MASPNQQHQPEISQPRGGGSNLNDDKNFDDQQKPGWKKFVAFVGPGFLVSMAYIDPGSLETDLQAGANHRYELSWVVLVALIFALIIQSLAANLGVCSVIGTAFAEFSSAASALSCCSACKDMG